MGIRNALLIGTARYRDPTLSRLRAPAQDARRLADLLRDPGPPLPKLCVNSRRNAWAGVG